MGPRERGEDACPSTAAVAVLPYAPLLFMGESMTRNAFAVVLVGALSSLCGLGCGDDDAPGGGTDGGFTTDGASGADTGVASDGGDATDAGASTDGATGEDGGTPTDAGTDAGDVDAGPSTAGPVTFATTCPEFTACGGDLVGSWRYTGVCVTEAEAEAAISGACATAEFLSGSGTVDGTLTFDGSMLMRNVTTDITVEFHVPSSCTMGLACSFIGPLIMGMTMVESASCVDAATDGCDCTVTDVTMISESDAYTTSGTFFENTRTTRRWDYCVDGTDLTAREITSGDGDDPVEPGTQSLTASSGT